MHLKEWLQAANKLGKGLSREQLVEELGTPPGRITGNGSGGWKVRTGNKNKQGSKRRKFDTTSTSAAAKEVNQLESQKKNINKEASLFGLEPMQTEHLADQDDAKAMTSGAPGDPDNKLPGKQSDARFKDRVKDALGSKYAVTVNPAQDSLKAIDKKYFDPIADPNTLPGINIRNSADLEAVLLSSFMQSKAWKEGAHAMREVVTKAGERTAKNLVPFAGTAFSADNTGQRLKELIDQPNITNGAQFLASSIETGGNFVSDVAVSTGVGAPIAAPAEAIANKAGLVDEVIDVSEQLMSRQKASYYPLR